MALQLRSITKVPAVPAALAAPTTAETITSPTSKTHLLIQNGATPSSITIVVPGTDTQGIARPDVTLVIGANTVQLIKIGREYKDPATGNATLTFTNVTTVLAARLEIA